MKLLKITLIATLCLSVFSCKNEKNSGEIKANTETSNELKIIPFEHASMILKYGDTNVYVDPTGESSAYEGFGKADIILITDIHGDHYNFKTLFEFDLESTLIIAPKAVADKFPKDFNPTYKILNNNEKTEAKGIEIEAIPMYNLREEALKFHPKGRGNGYVLTINNERIYISGDTEDIPEMRNLKNIDKAFVCMNLPYTMTVESAASAVLDFKPKTVYPYHYRGTDGKSDVELFKKIVNDSIKSINVELIKWY
ncbi:MBL fold metallo-hydrolase [Winogradskyella sp.]|uniref:MBL fold metallo-hydrolase n=1 Tax=Winogradskyella sp. TaxID=1883156 RepID=UPI002608F9EE|nr:MBL fold metallo-hydrolase [uncultured Winogradskyella sp.]